MKHLKKFVKGFVYASRGIIDGFEGRNMKFHGLATVAVVILGFIFKLNITEWMIILILIALVWSAELVNSSIEDLSNIVRDTNKLTYAATKKARDLAAGSVLIIAIVAAIIGLFVFFINII